MEPRDLFDRALAAIKAGDANALMALYAPGAVHVTLAGEPLSADQLRPLVERWLAAGGTPRPTGGAAVELEPYRPWTPRAVPDPRTGGREALMPVVMEIVEAEGPVLAGRAFGLYTRASGGKKLTGAAKAPLTGATWRLKIQERLEIARDGATTIDNDDVLRPAGTPPVRVRELGPRTLEEVPLDEVAELMHRLAEGGADDLKRAVLDAYGLIRLTARADEYLEHALELAASQPR